MFKFVSDIINKFKGEKPKSKYLMVTVVASINSEANAWSTKEIEASSHREAKCMARLYRDTFSKKLTKDTIVHTHVMDLTSYITIAHIKSYLAERAEPVNIDPETTTIKVDQLADIRATITSEIRRSRQITVVHPKDATIQEREDIHAIVQSTVRDAIWHSTKLITYVNKEGNTVISIGNPEKNDTTVQLN